MQIILHGLLSHKFEKIIEVNQSIEKDLLIDFIGSRHKNFKIFLKKSANQGNFYEIIESNKIFHFVPVITGTIGAAAMAAIGSMAGKFIAGAVTNIAIGGLLQLISPAEEVLMEQKTLLFCKALDFKVCKMLPLKAIKFQLDMAD